MVGGAARTPTARCAPSGWPRDNVVAYPDHYVQTTERHPMEHLASVIAERGYGGMRIGVEMDNYYYSAAAHAVLGRSLPGRRRPH